ncbi:MAG: chemotaxis protein CheD [Elusimicrobia bacterium]|nr:chemotaxis protein CheD [Elusimicrobiota bacterium]
MSLEIEKLVGMGEIKTGKENEMLWAILGSCAALIMYDEEKKIGAMAHVMLDKSSGVAVRSGKYADTAVPEMIKRLINNGASRRKLKVKLVGGANMFKWKSTAISTIGKRNIDAIERIVIDKGIPIVSKSTGGSFGCKIKYFVDTSVVVIRYTDGRTIEL